MALCLRGMYLPSPVIHWPGSVLVGDYNWKNVALQDQVGKSVELGPTDPD